MGKPGRAHLPVWLVSAAASLLVLGLAAAAPARAAMAVRAPAGPAAARADFTPAGCSAAPKSAGSELSARCFTLVRTNSRHQVMESADAPPAGALGPSDIQSAYNLNPAGGNGKTIAIVSAYGYASAESDLATFRSYYGLPPCTTANGCFSKLDENGGTNYPPSGGTGWAQAQAQDLDAVSSACPNCHITLVEATTSGIDDLGTAEDTAAALPGVVAISNSYGFSDDADDSVLQSYDHYYDHPGVAVVAPAGGSGDGVVGETLVDWPASSDDVLAVGGTTLTRDSSLPRGWDETAWNYGSSGCSSFEPQPAYQASLDTGCPDNKAVADISADADPETGLAVYDTDGESGWTQGGGTSLASALISGMFGLAADPVLGTYPVTYPYTDPDQSGDLNDITTGADGACGPPLCLAGPGWDGPTGLGTPDGVGALQQSGPAGSISGSVTSAGAPVAGATVTASDTANGEDVAATTDSAGHYSLTVLTGSYTVTASKFGYKPQTAAGVVVGQDVTVTENFTLKQPPADTLSGTVTDGSGHKWPLYAKIAISGDPDPVYTSPYTGQYSVRLPQKTAYTLTVSAVSLPGYTTSTTTVKIGTAGKTRNIKLDADQTACSAPGYTWNGSYTTFEGWPGTTPQDGWTNVDNDGSGIVWDFDNQSGTYNDRNPTGGTGQWAEAGTDLSGQPIDTSLTSPVVNLSKQADPQISFDTDNDYYSDEGVVADVDLSLDGGQTWSNVWTAATGAHGPVDIDIPQAAGKAHVQVRFHYTSTGGPNAAYGWWDIDNVWIGPATMSCGPARGGLVAGVVTDNNTGDGLDGATVTSAANPAETAATVGSPGAGDGFYELFAAGTGGQQFTAADGNYTPDTAAATVTANAVTRQDFALQAGQLSVSAGSLSSTVALGNSVTKRLTFTNTGTDPVQVSLGQRDEGSTPLGGARQATAPEPGVPVQRISGHFSPTAVGLKQSSLVKAHSTTVRAAGRQARPAGQAPADPWTAIADYPTTIQDNAVGYDEQNGDVYSVGGSDGYVTVPNGYVYDPAAGSWAPIAGDPDAVEAPAGAFVGGTMYVAGGWQGGGEEDLTTSSVYAYHPSSDSWTQVADLPEMVAGAASAVVDGQLYVIGGCTADCTPVTDAVYSYNPASNTWTSHASYPAGPVVFAACTGLGGELVCAGGTNGSTSYDSTWIYDPVTDTWTQGADMPYDDWGAAYAGANGSLEIVGGATQNSAVITNQAAAYDPSSNTWTALPNASTAEYRGGGACGMYTVGGSSPDPSTGLLGTIANAEVLPGYGSCGPGVPWLSESQSQFAVAPGQTVHVTVTMNASAVPQPGSYAAQLTIGTNTPYPVSPVTVTMQASPPKSWGEITGTVTGASTGDPIPGATVQICTMYDTKTGECGAVSYTLTTDVNGSYQLWLSKGYNPLAVNASASHYQPLVKIAKITAGGTSTVNFALDES